MSRFGGFPRLPQWQSVLSWESSVLGFPSPRMSRLWWCQPTIGRPRKEYEQQKESVKRRRSIFHLNLASQNAQ